MAEPEEEATPDESGTGSNPARSQQGNPTGTQPDDRELQVIDDADRGHGDVSLAHDGEVVAHGDGNGAGEGEQGELFSTEGLSISAWSGPLPSPEILSGFEQALPGAADRIIRMAEEAQAAEIEDRHVSTRAEARSFVLASFGVAYLSWLLALVTIGLIVVGQDGVAAITGIITAVTVGPQIIAQVRPKKTPDGGQGPK
jgi:uncharacterized membrane protein